MRALFWLLVLGLVACVLVFPTHVVGTNHDLVPITTIPQFHVAWMCDFDRQCHLDIGLK